MKNNIKGLGVALVTPFTAEGKIDYDSFEKLIDKVINGGVDYLVALGTTAETPTLSDNEKADVITFVKERNAGRLPIMVGIGGNCTAEILETIRHTDLNGIQAILSVTPYYNRPTQQGLYEHFMAVAKESPVPVMLYNVPGRTGVNLEAETALRIASDSGNILGIKEACGSIPQMARLLKNRPEGFRVMCGDDCLALPLIAIGGDGVISVAANALPSIFAQMVDAATKGDIKTSSALFMRTVDIIDAVFEEGNPAGVKALLEIKGITGNNVRLPLVAASAQLTEKLRRLCRENNL